MHRLLGAIESDALGAYSPPAILSLDSASL